MRPVTTICGTAGRVPADPAISILREYIMSLRLRIDAPFPSQMQDRVAQWLRLGGTRARLVVVK